MRSEGDGTSDGAVRVHLLGRLRVTRGGATVAGLEAAKAQELLAYLLLDRHRTHSRHTLAECLWSDCSTVQAHKHLRQALWQLATVLNKHAAARPEEPLLEIEDEWIGINRHAGLWVDIDAFEQMLHVAPGSPEGYAARQAAVNLYEGELLEGWYQDWCLFERERLQSLYLAALDGLISDCESRRDWTAGLHYGQTVLRYDPARERTHRRLMRLQYLAGDRAEALRQFQRCANALQEELGVQPSRPTLRLLEQIRADRIEAVLPSSRQSEENATTAAAVLARLEQIRLSLVSLEHEVEHDISLLSVARSGST